MENFGNCQSGVSCQLDTVAVGRLTVSEHYGRLLLAEISTLEFCQISTPVILAHTT